MCRFVLYMGRPLRLELLTTLPSHSIIHQSYHAVERKEPLNGDGFGVAWYAPKHSADPAAFRAHVEQVGRHLDGTAAARSRSIVKVCPRSSVSSAPAHPS